MGSESIRNAQEKVQKITKSEFIRLIDDMLSNKNFTINVENETIATVVNCETLNKESTRYGEDIKLYLSGNWKGRNSFILMSASDDVSTLPVFRIHVEWFGSHKKDRWFLFNISKDEETNTYNISGSLKYRLPDDDYTERNLLAKAYSFKEAIDSYLKKSK